jgi:hypothetical protein
MVKFTGSLQTVRNRPGTIIGPSGQAPMFRLVLEQRTGFIAKDFIAHSVIVPKTDKYCC